MRAHGGATQDRCPLPGELLDMTINEAALSCPQVLAVVGRYGIDSCCGGSLPVRTAAARHGISPAEIALDLADIALLTENR